jgi:hypothetical protein
VSLNLVSQFFKVDLGQINSVAPLLEVFSKAEIECKTLENGNTNPEQLPCDDKLMDESVIPTTLQFSFVCIKS